MNLTVVNSAASNLAVYGRTEAAPTITNHDWSHMVGSRGRIVSKRSATASGGVVSISKVLSRGDWYIGILNDNDNVVTVRSVVGQNPHGGRDCPADCNGNGRCEDGLCHCHPQYSGHDCSQSKY